MTRDEQPRSTVEHLIKHFLPRACHRFLLNQSDELRFVDVILRALFGALSGAAMFAVIAPGLPLTFDLKLATGCLFTGACVVGGATSSAFRCAVLLMFPSMLGSRGRTFLLLLVLSALYSGPVSNIQHNVETVAESLSCNLDLQVRNAKLLWRDAVTPFLKVAKEVVQGEAEFESEARDAHGAFADVRREVLGRDTDGRLLNERSQKADRNSTQERFALSTLTQCDGMVKGGIKACAKWFSDKWAECAKAIRVPVIKHILCVPMKLHFLCNIMRVMTGWCNEHIPVEKNFGQLFDHLNASIDLLNQEFTSKLVVKEYQQQAALDGQLLDGDFARGIRTSFRQVAARIRKLLDVFRLFMSFAFLSVFTQSLGYVRQFRGDVYFDNMYITKYFGIIDQRRKSLGKRHLLPLTPSERRKFVDPWSPKIHPEEIKEVVGSPRTRTHARTHACRYHSLCACAAVKCRSGSVRAPSGAGPADGGRVSLSCTGRGEQAHAYHLQRHEQPGGEHTGRRNLNDGAPLAEDVFRLQHVVEGSRRVRQPALRDYALLPGRLCVHQRCLLPPAGGALQLPSGLR